MEIRNAQLNDIEAIESIYAEARRFMQETGNKNQWINGYPLSELIIGDINNKDCYICVNFNNEILGVFSFKRGDDLSYTHIYEGKWLNDNPYGVVHRLVAAAKGQGVAAYCLQWCFDQCQNIRIDTHQDNIIMQNILRKNGYAQCGIIYNANGSRIAFQKSAI